MEGQFLKKLMYVKSSALMLLLTYSPYLEPQLFKARGFEVGDRVFQVLKLISITVLLVMYLRRTSKSIRILAPLGFQVWIGISTVANGGSIISWFGPACGMMATYFVLELMWNVGGRTAYEFLESLFKALVVFLIVNVVSYLLVGHTMFANVSFLGIDNRWIYFYLPLVAVSFLLDGARGKRPQLRSWVLWGVCLVHLSLVFSAGAMIAFLALPVIYVACRTVIRVKWIKPYLGRFLLVIFFLLNVLLVSGVLLRWLSPIIVDVLGKDITLAGRTWLWKVVGAEVSAKPLIGHGVFPLKETVEFFSMSTGGVSGTAVNHPHNFILYFAFRGGIPAALLFVAFLFASGLAIDRMEDVNVRLAFMTFVGTLFIAATIDSFDFSLIWLLLGLPLFWKTSSVVGCMPRHLEKRAEDLFTKE